MGVKIGADVQAYSPRLDDISNMNPSTDQFVGVGSGKLELKSAENARQSMGLGSKNQFYVRSSDGNVGVGTTSPGAKLDVNGEAKIRGNLDMSSKRVTNIADPQNNNDGANLGWVNRKVSNLSTPFYYMKRYSSFNLSNNGAVNWSGGTDMAKSSNSSTHVSLTSSSININQTGFYRLTFHGLFKSSANSNELHELHIDIRDGSGSWVTFSRPKTFGNTSFSGDAVFKRGSNTIYVRVVNKSGHTLKFENLQVTMSRIGDL